jgi:HlyD family secretion protein
MSAGMTFQTASKKLQAIQSLRIERMPEVSPSRSRRVSFRWIGGAALLAVGAIVLFMQWHALRGWTFGADVVRDQTNLLVAPEAFPSGAWKGSAPQLAAPAAAPPSVGTISAVGYVVARRQAVVSAEIAGRIIAVNFDEGQLAEAGVPLVELDASSTQSAVDLAVARVSSARATKAAAAATENVAREHLKRITTLAKEGVSTRATLDQATGDASVAAARLEQADADLAAANASLASATVALSRCIVRSPFTGVIVSRSAHLGEVVTAASDTVGRPSPIAVLVDRTSLEVEVDLNEAFLPRIRNGARAQVTFDAIPNLSVPANVYLIVPTANRDKASVRVRLKFESIDEKILPELTARVEFRDDVVSSSATASPSSSSSTAVAPN